MKKIGIMTWVGQNNLGSLLQATALQETIKNKGFSCELINYKKRDVRRYPYSKKNLIDKVFNRFSKSYYNNEKSFDEYRKQNLSLTKEFENFVELSSLNNYFDVFVCGSDQIWSPLSFDEKNFLNFADNNKIISYAPSFGVNSVEDENIKLILKKLLSRFKYISVRENTGKKIIKDIANIDAEVVLDPTLLLNSNEWNKFENDSIKSKIKKDYVLCYFLGESNKYVYKIEKFAKKNNLNIINIPYFKNKKINKYNINNESIGPSEFLYLVRNSKYVFTDSYHGILFSIIYQKQFFPFLRFNNNSKKSENSRVYNILNEFNLENIIVDSKFDFSKKINYSIVNKILEKRKKESLKFLFNSINNVNNLKKDKVIDSLSICSGCGACRTICPRNAIDIVLNENGFYEKKIVHKKCVDCGLCKNICPLINFSNNNISNAKSFYSYKSNNIEVLNMSSSGGFSFDIASLLNGEYYICGASLVNCYNVEHVLISPKHFDDIKRIQGSKYLQSNSFKIFDDLFKLDKNSKVLYFGTPCQVAGLNNLLLKKGLRDNYVLIEIICHGVPSHHLWDNYLNSIIKKNNFDKNNLKINFRDKKFGWNSKYISFSDLNKKVSVKEKNDDFYYFFMNESVLNSSCYECPFRKNSFADIRIGDYWGKKYSKDKTGVSMVIGMTDKGNDIINKLKTSKKGIIKKECLQDYFNNQKTTNFYNVFLNRNNIISLIKKNSSLKEIKNKYYKYDIICNKLYNLKKKLLG